MKYIPKIVIIGGGYAGLHIANALLTYAKNKEIELTIIEKRQIMIHKVAGLRAAVVGGNWVDSVLLPIENLKKYSCNIIFGTVNTINQEKKIIYYGEGIINESNKELSYDILVCCSGARNVCPAEPPENVKTIEDCKKFYARTRDAIHRSSNIVIIGGGPVSLELAGEIRDAYDFDPNGKKETFKEITIVTAATELFTSSVQKLPNKFHKKIENQLKQLEIGIRYNARVVSPPLRDFSKTSFIEGEQIIEFSDKKTMKADLVLSCIGWNLSNNFYPKEWLAGSGELDTKTTFCVGDRYDVFGFGDIANFARTKLAVNIIDSVNLLATNLKLCIAEFQKTGNTNGFSKLKFVEYKFGLSTIMIVPFGPYSGVAHINGYVFGNWISGFTKSKTLWVSDQFKLIKTKTPKAKLRYIDFQYPEPALKLESFTESSKTPKSSALSESSINRNSGLRDISPNRNSGLRDISPNRYSGLRDISQTSSLSNVQDIHAEEAMPKETTD